uniref:Zyg-1 polo box domain-containing protein n=1 Tax=Setaria digitata TaxID=48799 RepID=A0A915PPV1_9BILA
MFSGFKKFFLSLKQLQHTTDKVDEIALALYRKILDEISVVGARVVKIIFKPSFDSTARLMENGDFRVKFQDGRLALLKKGTDSVVVTKNNKQHRTLLSEESSMFDCAYKDALLLETFLESASFEIVKPFPFHFSNNSHFIMNEAMLATKENILGEQHTNHISERLINTTQQQSLSKNCHSADYVSKQPRAPLRDRNASLASKNSNLNVEIVQKARRTSSSSPENLQLSGHRVRMLAEGEYTLRGQFNKNGMQIPTRIILNGSNIVRELRISSNDSKIFVFKEDGHETRFRFDGIDYTCVPPRARSLLFTLWEKRSRLL